MKIEINIDDFLSYDEKKQLCIDYVKETLRGDRTQKERVLGNMAYSAAFSIFDSALTPEMLEQVRGKVKEVISNASEFGIFRKKDAWGQEDSAAYLEVKKAVEENKHLIAPLVKKAILERDYLKDLPKTSDYFGEVIVEALIKGLKQ
ncbi:MAG: hypothetical protein OEV44_02825 [Spirochaetota bacterium]|nr:hypothetical protein [Spirochaetota bacterium]